MVTSTFMPKYTIHFRKDYTHPVTYVKASTNDQRTDLSPDEYLHQVLNDESEIWVRNNCGAGEYFVASSHGDGFSSLTVFNVKRINRPRFEITRL